MTDFRKLETASTDMADEAMESVDAKRLLQYAGFVFRSVWRRRLLAGTLFVLAIVTTYGILRTQPKSYHVETKFFAQRQQAVASIGLRSYSAEEAIPTQTASDLVHSRDNLISLIHKTRLLEKWNFGDAEGWSEEDKVDALVGLLDGKLSIVTGEGTVTLSIDWPDGQMGYELLQAAKDNFLEARRVSEISAVEEAIATLQVRAESQRSEIEALQAQYQLQTRGLLAKGIVPRLAPFDPTAAQLRASIDARRRLISDAEESRRRKLEELQDQLATNLAKFGERYPDVIALRNEIEGLSREPQRLKTLRAEEKEYEEAYARHVIRPEQEVSRPEQGNDETGARVARPKRRSKLSNSSEDTIDEAEARIRNARLKYTMMLERMETARIDLDATRAAFKHRYSVIWPAQVAKYPDKPNVTRGLFFGFILAIVIAVAAATITDLLAGRFLERWQVERVLDMPVLAEVQSREQA